MSSTPIHYATYSNVDVYECMVGDTALMRRVSDNWVNATQILKAAKFPKASRTRILEKEIQTGVHEKIQGGYGKFQGTWIPLELARPLAHKYKITDEMAPILTYVPDPYNQLARKPKASAQSSFNGTPKASKTTRSTNSTAKKQRSVKQDKRRSDSMSQGNDRPLKKQASQTGLAPPVTDGSFWQSSEPPRFQAPPPPQQQHYGAPQMQPMYPNGQYAPAPPNGYYPPSYNQGQYNQPPYGMAPHPQMQQQQQHPYSQYQQHQIPQPQHYSAPYQQHKQKNSNENWSQDDANSTHMDETLQSDTSISSEHSAMEQHDSKNGKAMYTDALIHYFSNESEDVPMALLHPPSDFDFNEAIDEEGHTPLHWASSMASPVLIELLLKHGADPLTPNNTGLNCVSRAIFFNNSYQKGNFPEIVRLMKNCLYTPDKAGRTPLHYLCESTRSKTSIAEYYLRTILDQLSQGNENLIKIVVNHRDVNGECALDLARRSPDGVLYDMLKPYSDEHQEQSQRAMIPSSPLQARTPRQTEDDNDTTVNFQTDSVHGDEDDEQMDTLTASTLPKLPVNEVAPMLTSMLSSLADAYDSELKNKEEESLHTKTVLEKLQQDLESTESHKREVLAQIDSGASIKELAANIEDLEETTAKKTENLCRIYERSQALALANGVLREESKISGHLQENHGNQIQLALELTKLQINRTRIMDTMLAEITALNINERMNNYRKLIAMACDLKPENVDELIDEIEADLLTTVAN